MKTQSELNAIWEESYPMVYGYFFRRVTNKTEVEDLASVAMSQFVMNIANPETSKRIVNQKAYLWKIAHNQLVDFIRRKTRNPITIGYNDDITGIDQQTEDMRSSHYLAWQVDMQKCFQNSLKDVDYNIINDAIIEEIPAQELAIKYNYSYDNIRQKISRNLKKLKASCLDLWKLQNNSN